VYRSIRFVAAARFIERFFYACRRISSHERIKFIAIESQAKRGPVPVCKPNIQLVFSVGEPSFRNQASIYAEAVANGFNRVHRVVVGVEVLKVSNLDRGSQPSAAEMLGLARRSGPDLGFVGKT
jgi:hypothetical protein